MHEFHSFLELLTTLLMDPRIAVLFILLVCAAVCDYRTYKIPNWLTMGGATFGLLYSVFVPFPMHGGLPWALGGFVLGLLMLLPLYAIRTMGAGDVKLMAMAGAFLGIHDIFWAVIATFIVGGVAALWFALLKGASLRMLGNIKDFTQSMMVSAIAGVNATTPITANKSVGKMPYGVSISIATIGYVAAKHFGFL